MSNLAVSDGTKLQRDVCLLQERERGLRHLVQSKCCTLRPEAELELDRVRAEIRSTFEMIRRLRLNA